MAYEFLPFLFPGESRSRRPQFQHDPFDLFSEMSNSCQWMPLSRAEQRPVQKKPKAPTRWQELVQVPTVFTANDVTVREEAGDILIRAYREKGTEETGLVRHELVRRVKVPEDVEKESLKTLWLNRSHSLVVVGKKEQVEEQKLLEDKKVPEEEEHKDADHENLHPLTFLLDHFGYPGFTHCQCQKQAEEEGKQRMLHIHKKGEPEPERKHKTLQKMEKPAAEKVDEAAGNKEEAPKQPEEKAEEEQHGAEEEAPAANSSASSEEWVKPSAQDCTPNQERDVPFEVKPYKITLDITGYDKDDVKVEKHGDKVTVHGEHSGEDAEYSFVKSFTLPDFVDAENLTWKIDQDSVIITAPLIH